MQFSESWLRTLVNPAIDTNALAHQLTMAGLEVENTYCAAQPFSGVVVARIVAIAPHPDANKLRVCQVDDGSPELLQIVCGAPNAAVGLTVPLARVGAQLPGGIKIGMATMRGVVSAGMLCSARELGLAQDEGGLFEMANDLEPGTDLRAALDLDDTIFVLKLTPNRADCLSMLGVAREVSALTGAPITLPSTSPVAVSLTDRLPVHIEAPELCGRFAGRVIRGVNARAQTPAWMRTRLERAGQRSVSALVDISNYVMLELGRPSHVFDLDKIKGDLHVRWAHAGERLELLSGALVDLDDKVGVVAAGTVVESMAGIMGGEASAVSLDTQNIYLEAAFWWPSAIAGRARRYKFSSEASHRFERGVDFDNIAEHVEYLTRLIVDICGGQVAPLDDQIVNLPTRASVRMRLARCHRVLGVAVTAEEVAQIFSRLGLPFKREQDDFIVEPPSYRFDLEIEEDLIEEVARIYGFERIPSVPPRAQAVMQVQAEVRRSLHTLRRSVATRDYQEVVNYSFVEADWERDYAGNHDPLRLRNPIASHLSVMRTSLIAGLVAIVRHNANRKQPRVRLFELGRVFLRDALQPDAPLAVAGLRQPLRLAGVAWGSADEEQWGESTRQVDFYDVKMDVEALFAGRAKQLRFVAAAHPALHPGRSARIELAGRCVGWLGELHPARTLQADLPHPPIVFELDVDTLAQTDLPVVTDFSRQPMVLRDLALWVKEEVSAQAILDTIAATVRADPTLALVQDVRLFDVWRDKVQENRQATREKSLAFRFWLQDAVVTLEETRVTECLNRIKEALATAHGARQRV